MLYHAVLYYFISLKHRKEYTARLAVFHLPDLAGRSDAISGRSVAQRS